MDNGQPSACPYIQLEKEELKYYHGCGLVIAAEQHGFIYDLLYIASDIIDGNVPEKSIKPCVSDIVNKLPLNNGQNVKFWLCMASCNELCNPIEIADYNVDIAIDIICKEIIKQKKKK